MIKGTQICLGLIASLLLATVAWGQMVDGSGPDEIERLVPNQRGFWDGNRYIGFRPKHIKEQQPSQFRTTSKIARPVVSDSDVDFQAAGGTESYVATASYADGGVVDGAWDPSTSVDGTILPDGDWGNGCDTCVASACRPSNFWIGTEYLLWWTKGMSAVPLVTTSPDGTAQAQAGVLPDATTLFSNERLGNDARSGGRFSFGRWLDPCQQTALELSYLFLEEETTRFSASADDATIIARPFLNTVTNQEISRLIVFPNLVDGTVSVQAETSFQAAEALIRRVAVETSESQIDYLLGYRYAGLKGRLAITESTTGLADPVDGVEIDLFDRFHTDNDFHGGQLGLRYVQQPHAPWTLELVGKFALGGTHSRATIAGQTVTTSPTGDTSTAAAGLLAQGTNSGNFEDDQFSTITEIGLKVRRQYCGFTATFGYSFLYWSDIARAVDQIDRGINVTQVPPGTLDGDPRPAFEFQKTDFWAQGLNFGLEYLF
ncbi:MAG: BBP7 family outer membrane beta-barrel protein [Planctomycetales bacterium]|nr:BBP7 family outer membrane beta-barrel protein [Planctomycetales bacterium]